MRPGHEQKRRLTAVPGRGGDPARKPRAEVGGGAGRGRRKVAGWGGRKVAGRGKRSVTGQGGRLIVGKGGRPVVDSDGTPVVGGGGRPVMGRTGGSVARKREKGPSQGASQIGQGAVKGGWAVGSHVREKKRGSWKNVV